MNNYWAFLEMRSSADLIGDRTALRERLATDSYLYLPAVIDPAKVIALRRRILEVLADRGWIYKGDFLMSAFSIIPPLKEGEAEWLAGYDAVQHLEEFHTLAHDPALVSVMRDVVGDHAFPHPLKIVRLAFPNNFEVATPPHQDYPNNQGTPNLTASWIPVGDCPRTLGGLAVLRGSHQAGVLPLDHHPGAGNRQAIIPPELLEELRWVTTDFEAGDILLFPSTTVHASMNNATDSLRVSVDFRYQDEGEALTPLVLEPHFQQSTWDEIYAGWSSTELQYYWRDLDYEVVPFEELPLVSGPAPAEMSPEELWGQLHQQNKRHEQRMARLAEAGIVGNGP
jgi:hypothetical protein